MGERSIKLNPMYGHANSALGQALISQGRLTEALAAIRRRAELYPEGHRDRAAAEAHRAYCESLIALDGRLAAVLRGTDRPVDDRECLRFSTLCQVKKRYAAAVRFATEAFTHAPMLAENLRAHARYDAACAAAQAGCGLGDDAATLSDAERGRWRKQAREWLQADLNAWSKFLDGNPSNRLRTGKAMAHWQVDPDLARLRERIAIGVLAEGERNECVALWAEVAAVLARAEK
jgi:hypothetical protein